MMLPILISVAVAPVSYLACSAPSAEVVARIARAAEKTPSRKWIAGILISLMRFNVSVLLLGSVSCGSAVIEYRLGTASKKKPFATSSCGASFSRSQGQQPVNEIATRDLQNASASASSWPGLVVQKRRRDCLTLPWRGRVGTHKRSEMRDGVG